MLITDLNQIITDLDGRPMRLDAERILTLRLAIREALCAASPDTSDREKFDRFTLASKVAKAETEIEIGVDEAKAIKDATGKFLAPVALGPVWQALGETP